MKRTGADSGQFFPVLARRVCRNNAGSPSGCCPGRSGRTGSSISQMKDQVVLINTARGGLIDTKALIENIESGKIGAAGLDVIENEFGMYYFDRKSDILDKRDLYILRGFPNVIVTPHMAFYTDQAISDMVKHSLESCLLVDQGKPNPWNVL